MKSCIDVFVERQHCSRRHTQVELTSPRKCADTTQKIARKAGTVPESTNAGTQGRPVDMPCPGPFHLSHIYDVCPIPDPDVGLSIFVCDVEHTSFHFGLCGRKFVLCLFGQCPGLCTICHSWQHTGVVHLSLQADGKVALNISRCFAYATQPAMILRCISLCWFFSMRL